ncbi:hypothetical protein MYX65_01685 [Acidobacteria bacterium AH-259-L09]|nr:hypothetical protein [Acidobacteria bacterium AH-259-L09]
MRTRGILAATIILLALTDGSFAQINGTSEPVETIIDTGRAEEVGKIRLGAASNTIADTITIEFGGLPVANNTATGIKISGSLVPTSVDVDNADGVITLTVPAATAGQSLDLEGIRIDVDGSSVSSVKAALKTVVNAITIGGVAGPNELTVAKSVLPGIFVSPSEDPAADSAAMFTNGSLVDASATLLVTEGFADAWQAFDLVKFGGIQKRVSTTGSSATNGTKIQLTMIGLPEGIVMTAEVGSSTSSTIDITPQDLTLTSDDPTRSFSIADSDLTEVEEIQVDFTVSTDASLPEGCEQRSQCPFVSGEVGVGVSLAPIGGSARPGFGLDLLPEGGFTALSIIASATYLHFPFIISDVGFDTLIFISNTTADPFGDFGAIPQDGTITFYFFANDSTSFSYTTSEDSPGKGLTEGVLKAGSIYEVLASELLVSAGRLRGFTGYIFAVVGAPNAHGNFVVTNSNGFTQGGPALVVSPIRGEIVPPERLGH